MLNIMTTKRKLEILKTKTQSRLKKYVCDYILSYRDDATMKNFCLDVVYNGCQSGVVGDLVYSKDTARFFDEYYSEIESLRFNFMNENKVNQFVTSRQDLKSSLVWFAFEEMMKEIIRELGIEENVCERYYMNKRRLFG